jgi:hypothetical protein
MKKLLLSIAVIASALTVNAQVDTLTSHFVGNPSLYYAASTPDSGYVSGTNKFGDLAKMQLFDAAYGVTGAGTITKVALGIPVKTDGGGSFQVAIWDDNAGVPANLVAPIAVVNVTLASVDTSSAAYSIVDGTRFYNHIATFASPVTIPANQKFWAGIILPTTAGNSVALFSNNATTNPFAASSTHTGEVWDNGTFHSLSAAWGANLTLGIYPIVDLTLSVNENVISASVYPNPATSELNIKTTEEIASVVITTTDGKTVATGNTATINVSSLNAGMYIYQVTTISGKIGTGNFVKN